MTNTDASALPFDDPTAPADPRPAFAAAARTAAEVLALVDASPASLALPTPCDAFDVRALAGHLVMVADRVAAIGAGGSPFTVPEPDVADGGHAAAWERSFAGAAEVWADDDVLHRVLTLPWTTMRGRAALAIYTSEVTLHTWDLAAALGATPTYDDEAVAVSYEAMSQAWNQEIADATRAQLGEQVPFQDPVAVADDASVLDRLLAVSGRTPAR